MQVGLFCFRSIRDIDESVWDAIVPEKDVFHLWRFIRAVEESQVENSEFWYLLFYANDTLVASAVVSAFKVNLDLFIGNNKFIRYIKKIAPNFFRIKILMCGLPVSLGQQNLIINVKQYSTEVFSLLSTKMDEISKQRKIKFQIIKEFKKKDIKDLRMEKYGFLKADSIPYMHMKIQWESFTDFLACMKHNYRRQVLQSLKKINRYSPNVVTNNGHSVNDKPALFIADTGLSSPSVFYEKYMKVMDRATVKMEILNEEFFRKIFSFMRNDLLILVIADNKKVYGSALLIKHGEELTFALLGKDDEKDHFDSYFNLIYGIIEIAIEGKYKQLNLGQTSYWTKQRLGGIPEDEYIFIKSSGQLIQFCLNKFRHLIFPATILTEVKPFKAAMVREEVFK